MTHETNPQQTAPGSGPLPTVFVGLFHQHGEDQDSAWTVAGETSEACERAALEVLSYGLEPNEAPPASESLTELSPNDWYWRVDELPVEPRAPGDSGRHETPGERATVLLRFAAEDAAKASRHWERWLDEKPDSHESDCAGQAASEAHSALRHLAAEVAEVLLAEADCDKDRVAEKLVDAEALQEDVAAAARDAEKGHY